MRLFKKDNTHTFKQVVIQNKILKYFFPIFILQSCDRTYFIVRHAEKADQSYDSPLSLAGQDSPLKLKNNFGNQLPDSIFVSSFIRTRQTTAPTAFAKGISRIEINQQDTATLIYFIKRLNNITQNKILITRHSNTIPKH